MTSFGAEPGLLVRDSTYFSNNITSEHFFTSGKAVVPVLSIGVLCAQNKYNRKTVIYFVHCYYLLGCLKDFFFSSSPQT